MPLPAVTLTLQTKNLTSMFPGPVHKWPTHNFGEISSSSSEDNGWLYFLGKNYLLEESDYLNGKLPDKISS